MQSNVHCTVKCSLQCNATFSCVHLQRASQLRVRFCLWRGARDAMMKRSENGLLRREMKKGVVTQTWSGVSPLPTWGQWPFRGAGGRYLENTSKVNLNWSRCGTLGHLELCPFVELKAFNRTGTDEVSLSADVRHGQNREDNVWTMCPQDPLDNETLEAPHSSSNLLYSYFSTPTSLPNAHIVYVLTWNQQWSWIVSE